MGDISQIADGLHDAGLVVGRHDGNQRDIGTHEALKSLRGNATGPIRFDKVHPEAGGAEQGEVVEDGVMFDGGHDDAVALAVALPYALGNPQKREHVGLGAATRENDLTRADARAHAARDRAPALLQPNGRAAP